MLAPQLQHRSTALVFEANSTFYKQVASMELITLDIFSITDHTLRLRRSFSVGARRFDFEANLDSTNRPYRDSSGRCIINDVHNS